MLVDQVLERRVRRSRVTANLACHRQRNVLPDPCWLLLRRRERGFGITTLNRNHCHCLVIPFRVRL